MTAIADAIQEGIDRIDVRMRHVVSMLSPLEMIMASLGLPIRALALENIPGRVVAETVQTVQVKGVEVGSDSLERREANEAQVMQLAVLTSMDEKIGKISSSAGGDDVRGIKALLTEYLPKLAASPSKLGTKMSDWGS